MPIGLDRRGAARLTAPTPSAPPARFLPCRVPDTAPPRKTRQWGSLSDRALTARGSARKQCHLLRRLKLRSR